MKYKPVVYIAVILVSMLILYGCSPGSIQGNSYSGRAYGFSFDFPEGWSPLSGSEVEERFGRPESKLLVCIGDAERKALMHIAKMNVPMADSIKVIEPTVKYFDTHFSNKVEGYRRIKLGGMDLGGRGAVELIFEKPGKTAPKVWVKQIYFANRGYFLCLTFGTPSTERSKGKRALDSLIDSWKWQN